MDQKNLVYLGVIVAVLIAVAAPFIASSNPDGLESAFFGIFGAKDIHGSELNEDAAGAAEEQVQEITGNTFSFASPFPDYTIEGMDKPGEVLVIVVGTLVVLGVAFGLARALSRPE